MKLTSETLERLAIITTPSNNIDFISITPKEKVIVIELKDKSDSYFTNNFETEVTYNGADDQERLITHRMNLNGEFIDKEGCFTGRCIQQIHTFNSYKKSNGNLPKEILEQYKYLKEIF